MVQLSRTNQRRVILEEVRKLKNHPTADELYDIVRKRLPRISLGTVYRNLELLSETGNILKLSTGAKQKRFDGRTDNHFHFRCVHCDRIRDYERDEMIPLKEMLDQALENDDKLNNYFLEFTGSCEQCGSVSK